LCLLFLQNKMHINDWSAIQTLFDKLNKQLEKAQKATEGLLGVPRVYIRLLVELEDFLVKTLGNKEAKKKMRCARAAGSVDYWGQTGPC
jgi:translation initiation factor 3 subunit C